jgi:hypothetical protein
MLVGILFPQVENPSADGLLKAGPLRGHPSHLDFDGSLPGRLWIALSRLPRVFLLESASEMVQTGKLTVSRNLL